MMKKSLMLLLFLLTFLENASAQGKSFTLFFAAGSVFILDGNQETAGRTNMRITESQSLKLGEGASVILIADNKTAMPLSKAGTYTFKAIEQHLEEISGSLTTKYFTYVIEEMTAAHDAKADELPGGVHRSDVLMHMPFDSCLIIQQSMRFSWDRGISSQPLYLIIKEHNGRKIFSEAIQDTAFIYPVKSGIKDMTCEWLVAYEEDPSDNAVTKTFILASDTTIKRINKEWSDLKKNLVFTPELNELLTLNFYSRNKLFIEEWDTLLSARARYPDSALFLDYYQRFTQKHGR